MKQTLRTFYRSILIVAAVLAGSHSQVLATHIYGADLFYTWVSGNTYNVTLNVYGDCSGSSFPALTNATAQVTVFNGSTTYTNLTLICQSPVTGVEVTPVCPSQINNTVCNSGSLPGVKKFVYSAQVTLNTTSTNWRFRFTGTMGSTSSAGRSTSITNISSGSSGSVMNLEATLNNTGGANSSPTYTTIPTPFFCINKSASYNPGTIDPNSDSLSYALVPGLIASGTVTYLTGYSATAPLAAATGSFNTSSTNGQVNFTPNLVQQSLVVHQVNEYRAGVLVGTSMREMTFVVLNNCSNNPPGGKISGANSGRIDTAGTVITVCQSAGTLNFSINATDLDTDAINVVYTGLPTGATFNVTNNNTTAPTGSFSWNVSNVAPGSYNFFITYTDDGCPLSSKQTVAYTVVVLPRPSVAVNVTALATCTKKAVFTITPSSYPAWLQVIQGSTVVHNFTGVTSPQTDSLAPGSYIVRFYNSDTCFKDSNLVIAPPPVIGISLAVSPVKCYNDTNAAVVVTASGGKPSYTYAVNSGAFGSSNTFSNLGWGYYTFRIKDQNDCIKDSLILIQNPLKVGADIFYDQPPCNYYNSGVITVNGKNTKSPYTYALGAGAYSSTNTFTGLFSGSYAVHVRDSNNCQLDTTAVLPDSIKVHANAVLTNILCNGDSTGVITLNAFGATAPYRYQRTGFGTLSPVNTFNGLKAITHTFHIEDTNKCYLDTNITLTQPTRITSTVTITNVLCNSDTSGSIIINGNGGVPTYTFAIGAGSYGVSNIFTPLPAGAHILHVKDNNGCVRDTTVSITQPTKLNYSNVQVTHPTCNGALNGQVALTGTGGVTNYTYAINTGTFSSTSTFGGLGAGVDTFRIKDANGCTRDTIVTLVQPTRIVPGIAIKRSTCTPLNNGSITISATGGTPSYTFAQGTGSYSVSTLFSPLASGSYTMHVKDANGCIVDTTVSVGDSFIVTGNITVVNAHCHDSSTGSVTAVGGGGVSPYTYALGTGSYGATNIFGGLGAGPYLVKIKDNLGCRKDTNITVKEPTQVVPALTITEPSCYGYSDGVIQLSATGGTPGYERTINNNGFVPISDIQGLAAGKYTVSVQDANGCRIDTSVTIGQPTGIKFRLDIENLRCNGDSSGTIEIDGTGGVPPYMYNYDMTPFVTTPILAKISAGQHTVKMRDANGCIRDTAVYVTEPAKLLVVSPVITHPTCEGYPDGAAKVYGNGGVQPYEFAMNGGSYQSSNQFSGLKEGMNSVRVKDANNCFYDTLLELTGYPHIIFDDIISDAVSCYGYRDGKVTLLVSGGMQPLQYNIGTSAPGSAFEFDSLAAGTYKFRVTDEKGCFKDTSFAVQTPDSLKLSTKSTPNDCEGYDNGGRLEVIAEGGTPGYRYKWNTEPVQEEYLIKNMPNGTYQVVVTDANECTDSTRALIVYDDCCIIFVPDVFTPNGDGLNDLARVRVKGDFVLQTFAIFNRYGQKVFETTDMSQGWNGLYNADNQDAATYNYYVKGICGNGGKKEIFKKGTITLVR